MKFKLNRVKQDPNANTIGPKNANNQYFSGDYYTRIDTLVRETIQNPLDNPKAKSKPVRIVFKHRTVPISEIPEIQSLRETIDALLQTLDSYKGESIGLVQGFIDFYMRAKKSMSSENINLLQISDYNTTGLIGRRNDMKSNLGRFLGGDGVFDDDSSGGGSGGLGKYAPFMVSNIGFCLYSSRNTNKEFIYYGWGKYFTHEIKGKRYTGEINIGGKDNDVMIRKSPLKEGFLSERTTIGTDVYALGFSLQDQDENKWEVDVSKAVIRNFFGAIFDKKLEVEIVSLDNSTISINSDTILNHSHLFDESKTKSTNDLIPESITKEALKIYSEGRIFRSNQGDTPILRKCMVRILQDDDLSRNFTFMRGPKMLIYKDKISAGDINFAGVFICESEQGNKELRLLEDSHHKNWKYSLSPKGKKIRKEIYGFIEKCVNKVATFENPDEFSISGASLLSFGNTNKGKPNKETTKTIGKSTAVIYPKNIGTTSISKNNFNGEITVDRKGKKKKTKPKKPAYKKPNNPPVEPKSNPSNKRKERIYKVEDFKAMIFKNDQTLNEYHLYIESQIKTNIRSIVFDIPMENGKLAEIDFIESITDSLNNKQNRLTAKGDAINEFENFQLEAGSNKFIVKTRFNKKVQIIIK